jgi:Na+/proline symporter
VWDYGRTHDKFRVFDMRFSLSEAYTFWAALIGGAVLTIGSHGTDHMMVQRYLSARSQRDAGLALFLSGIVVFAQFALFLFIGVELACYYAGNEEVAALKSDKVFAHFMIHGFPQGTGLIGLMLASVLAAAMSAGSLNASASAVLNDFYLSWRPGPHSSRKLVTISRGLTIVFGLLQIGIGIWAERLSDTMVSNALTIASFSAGLLLGVFLLGVAAPRVGQKAALIGLVCGLSVLLFVQFGPSLSAKFGGPELKWKIAFPWLSVIGVTTTFLSGWLAAWVYPREGVQRVDVPAAVAS